MRYDVYLTHVFDYVSANIPGDFGIISDIKESGKWCALIKVDTALSHLVINVQASNTMALEYAKANVKNDIRIIEADASIGILNAIATAFASIKIAGESESLALTSYGDLVNKISVSGDSNVNGFEFSVPNTEVKHALSGEYVVSLLTTVSKVCDLIRVYGIHTDALLAEALAIILVKVGGEKAELGIQITPAKTILYGVAHLYDWDDMSLAELDEVKDGVLHDLDYLWEED